MNRLLSTILVFVFIATSASAADCAQIAGCRFKNPFSELLGHRYFETKTIVLKNDGTFIHFSEMSYPKFFESNISSREIGTWSCSDDTMTFVINDTEHAAWLGTADQLTGMEFPENPIRPYEGALPVIKIRAWVSPDFDYGSYLGPFSSYYDMVYEKIDGKFVCK
ncbi:MAG: hypothetical protein K0U66_00795 [Gammaproteobacteria bacterium]|nr:hypothetical protein [Gammaproteobacteria bacterium]